MYRYAVSSYKYSGMWYTRVMPVCHEIIFILSYFFEELWTENGSNIWYWDNIRMKMHVGAITYNRKH